MISLRLRNLIFVIMILIIFLKIIFLSKDFYEPYKSFDLFDSFDNLKYSKLLYPTRNKSRHIYYKNITNILNNKISDNSVLIFEPGLYHQECTPGYTKYFLDLGYKVDVIFDSFGINAFSFFYPFENVRLFFFFQNLSIFSEYSKEFQTILKNYSYIIIESTEPFKIKTYEDLGLFKMNNTIFVVHNYEYINSTGITMLSKQNRIWSLGNLNNTLFVNPHYFGKIKRRKKNKITTFFITSNGNRYYKDLVLAAEKIKNEGLQFKVIVIGKGEEFSYKNISDNLKTNFKFRYHVGFFELYKSVISSDYIIINLYPNYTTNDEYRTIILTGASQLSFGFLKPALIHKGFAKFYNMSSENSFLFDNTTFYKIMKKTVLLNDILYQKKQNNLIKLSVNLYKISYDNVVKTINSILLQ